MCVFIILNIKHLSLNLEITVFTSFASDAWTLKEVNLFFVDKGKSSFRLQEVNRFVCQRYFQLASKRAFTNNYSDLNGVNCARTVASDKSLIK